MDFWLSWVSPMNFSVSTLVARVIVVILVVLKRKKRAGYMRIVEFSHEALYFGGRALCFGTALDFRG
jgi:hypothetical protein